METIYTVDYFIKKFQKIPDKNWFIGDFWDRDNPQKMCALGHCGFGRECKALHSLFPRTDNIGSFVSSINDGTDKRYQQPTPKQRILAALYDIKAMQQPKVEEPKVVYKTVVIDSAVKELQTAELKEN